MTSGQAQELGSQRCGGHLGLLICLEISDCGAQRCDGDRGSRSGGVLLEPLK